MNIVLLGGPGAGKGTQAAFLVEKYKMLHISTGDLLREAVANETEAGKKAKEYMDSGNLVPDELIIGIMKEKFKTEDISNGLILDGFPRTVAQAEALDSMMSEIGSKIDMTILIDTPDEVIIQRICSRRMCKQCGAIGSVNGLSDDEIADYKCHSCGGEMYQRDDDNEKTVLNRINVYNQSTAPLVDYYSAQNKLKKVNGAASAPGKDGATVVFEELDKYFQ